MMVIRVMTSTWSSSDEQRRLVTKLNQKFASSLPITFAKTHVSIVPHTNKPQQVLVAFLSCFAFDNIQL